MADSEEDEEEPLDPSSQFELPSHEELNQRNAIKNMKQAKEPTRMEKRIKFNRQMNRILSTGAVSSLPYIRDLHVDYFLSPHFVKMYRLLLISVYGSYAVMAVAVLSFYLLDIYMDLLDGSLIENASYIMHIFLIFNIVLSIIGCYATFQFGISEDDAFALRTLADGLVRNSNECDTITKFMLDEGQHRLTNDRQFITNQSEVKYELNKTLRQMNALGKTLNDYAKTVKNDELKRVQHGIQTVYQDLYMYSIRLRLCQDKSKILRLFWSKEVSKKEPQHVPALTEKEFEELKVRMDNDSTDYIHQELTFRFSDFETFDKNDDEKVDLMEFEQELDKIYTRLAIEIQDKYEKNRSPEDLALEKEQRAWQRRNTNIILRNFRKYIHKKSK
eukprot:251222_1